jgi:hypothetical protein
MLKMLRRRTDKRVRSGPHELGSEGTPVHSGALPSQRVPRHRAWAPVARFFGWWAGTFAFLAGFSVCPFCGQPGCAGGPAFAGVLGGISAFFISMLRRGKRAQRASTAKRPDDSQGH